VPGTTPPAPTIQSDKADYAPGELVTLTGSGWQPGESVNIVVNDDAGQTWNRNVNVIADASGNISDSFNLPDWFVATYSVTATGAQSGTVTTTFTDSNPTDLVVNPTSATVTRGVSATYNLTVQMGGNSTNCTTTLSASGLPTGANASFSGTNPRTGNSNYSSTLTVTTTATGMESGRTPLGSNEFTVTVTRGSDCQGNAPISKQATLVVNPRAPSGLTATASGQNAINLSWTASPDSAAITKYVVFEGTTEVASTANNTTTSASITGLAAGSTHTYTVKARYTANSTNFDSNASNSSTATTAAADSTAPTVSSINRANANPTNASSVAWNVTFSESVTSVDAGDFQLANTGLTGPGSINVTGSGANYSVTANTGTGSGTLGLNLNDNDSIRRRRQQARRHRDRHRGWWRNR